MSNGNGTTKTTKERTFDYNNFKTAVEMFDHIRFHGLQVDNASISRAQDLIGHSTEDDLAQIASKEHADIFYNVLIHVWDFERIIRFYNKYSNPDYRRIKEESDGHKRNYKEASEMCSQRNIKIAELNVEIETLEARCKQDGEALYKAVTERDALRRQVMELKAKLYDIMTATAV